MADPTDTADNEPQSGEAAIMDALSIPDDKRPDPEDHTDNVEVAADAEKDEGATNDAGIDIGGTEAKTDTGAGATDTGDGATGETPGGKSAADQGEKSETAGGTPADGDAASEGDSGKDEAEPAATAEPLTEEDLTPPDGLKDNARDRFQRMATGYKEIQERTTSLETQLSESQQQLEGIRETFDGYESDQIGSALEMLQGGFTADEIRGATNFLTATKTGNTSAALRMLEDARVNISVLHGEAVPGVSLYQRNPELVRMVENLELTEEAAERWAMQQARQGAQQPQANTGMGQSAQQPQASNPQMQGMQEQLQRAGAAAVAALEENWKAHDPDYTVKQKWLEPQIAQIAENFPPDQWAEQIKSRYESANTLLSAAGVGAKPPAAKTPRPLSSANGTSAQGAPSNMQEAINQSLGISGS